MDGVRELMSTHVFDVLALSETCLSPNITHNEVDIPGYTVARKDRTGSAKLNGGGVLLYVRENIKSQHTKPRTMQIRCTKLYRV